MTSVLTLEVLNLLEVSSHLVPLVLLVITKQICLILEHHGCELPGSVDTWNFFIICCIVIRGWLNPGAEPGIRRADCKAGGGEGCWHTQAPSCSRASRTLYHVDALQILKTAQKALESPLS